MLTEYHKHGRLIDAGTIEAAEDSAASAWLADTLAGQHSLLTVNSNEQAARLSAKLRAEFIRLGLVDEAGAVPVGLQGNYAGVNDLVQARRIGRHLVGYEGNRTGPINRAQYRVLATREDGGLVVAPVLGRGPDGEERHGEKMTLPGDYVAEHIELGYAATEYSIQGVTVGTTHNLTTPNTSRAAFYMAMTRGQHTNTAHVATQTVPDHDPAPGAVHDAVHRSPAAVLALAFERVRTGSKRANEHRRVARRGELGADRGRADGRVRRGGHRRAHRGLARPARRPRPPHPRPSGPGWPPKTAPPPSPGSCAAPSSPATTPAKSSTTRSPNASLADARQLTNVLHDRITTNRHCLWTPLATPTPTGHPQSTTPTTSVCSPSSPPPPTTAPASSAPKPSRSSPVWATDAFGPLPDDPEQRRAWRAAGRDRRRAPRTHRPRRPRQPDRAATQARAAGGLRLLPRLLARAGPPRRRHRRNAA